MTRTRRGLRALLGLVPSTASVLRAGREVAVAPDNLVVGDVLVLRPGERAATDGWIRAGRTSLDASAITGESIPVEAGPAMRSTQAPSTAAALSRSRSPPRPRTARWPGSGTSSKRGRNARAQADAWRTQGRRGVGTGNRDGAELRLGKPGWVDAGPLAAAVERLQAEGATVVLVERDGRLLGAVAAVRDELRPEAPEAVRRMRELGIDVAMLTGDNPRTTAVLARQAGIGSVHAELRPADKADLLPRIAVVGDGVNDAPAWPRPTSASRWARWAPTAIETADVALMGADLRHLPQTLANARGPARSCCRSSGSRC